MVHVIVIEAVLCMYQTVTLIVILVGLHMDVLMAVDLHILVLLM